MNRPTLARTLPALPPTLVTALAAAPPAPALAQEIKDPLVVIAPGLPANLPSIPAATWDRALNDDPVLNNNGDILVQALLDGVPSSADVVLVAGQPGDLRVILQEGDTFPGLNLPFRRASGASYNINDEGDIASWAQLQSGGTVNFNNDAFIFFYDAQTDTARPIIRENDPYDFDTGAFYDLSSIYYPAMSDDGNLIAFTAFLTGPDVGLKTRTAWITDRDGTLDLAIRAGQNVPGTNREVTEVLTSRPTVNANATAYATLRWEDSDPGDFPPGSPFEFGSGLYFYADDDLVISKRAESKDFAPNTPGFQLTDFSRWFAGNAEGDIAYEADSIEIVAGSPTGNTIRGLFYEADDFGATLIAEYGVTIAPGTFGADGFKRILEVNDSWVINDSEQTAFTATLANDDGTIADLSGLFRDSPTSLLAVAYASNSGDDNGSFIPGAGDVTIKSISRDQPWLNSAGQIAFLATLEGTGVTPDNDEALIITDPDLTLRIALRTGDQINISDNPAAPDLRTIEEIEIPSFSASTSDGRRTPFNDLGQFAARVSLAGTSDDAIVIAQNEPAQTCPADTNNDQTVGLDDLLTVLANFGNAPAGGPADGDIHPPGAPDGTVGLEDLLLVLANFGNTCP